MLAPGIEKPNTLLVFYRVSCPTCKLTLPYVHRVQMPVLGISQDDAESTEKFRQQFEVKIESVLDLASEGYPASSQFGVHHVPTMFVLDENGKIAERIEGFDKDALERLGASFDESELVPEFRPG